MSQKCVAAISFQMNEQKCSWQNPFCNSTGPEPLKVYKSLGVMLEETARCRKRGGSFASSLGSMSFPRTPAPECNRSFPLGGRGCAHVELSGSFQFRNKWGMSSELEIANSKRIIVIKYEGGLVFI